MVRRCRIISELRYFRKMTPASLGSNGSLPFLAKTF